jgi:nucleoside-diphosphate-sugar epimerase
MRKPTENTVLLLGATGATGRLLAAQLLDKGASVKAIVRSPDRLPESLRNHPRLMVIHANLFDLGDAELRQLTEDCNAAASCLGHNLSWKGIFGPPYRLVTDATRRLCEAMQARNRETPARFVLMNTAGNSNRDLNEPLPLGQRIVTMLLRLAIPPHADNEKAADYLRVDVGQNGQALEWCVVRPDTLTNETESAEYEVFASPVSDPIFDPGKTSRLNVARFIADLITDDEAWGRWRGQMPVIYDKG